MVAGGSDWRPKIPGLDWEGLGPLKCVVGENES